MAIKVYASGNTLTVGIDTYAPNSGLTASLSTETGYTDYVIVQDSAGKYPLTALYSDIVKQDGTTSWGASATAVRDALNTLFSDTNPNNYGDATDVSNNTSEINSVKSRVTTAEGDISEIEKAVQVAKTGGGRGLYYDDGKSTSSSRVSLDSGLALIQGGANTFINVEEASPGVQTFTVAAGASGSETRFEALSLSGTTTANSAILELARGTTFRLNNGTYNVNLQPATLTADRSILFPDKAGTIALTSDLPSLTGYVDTSGTPLNNQVAVFTDADTIEGAPELTIDAGAVTVDGDFNVVSPLKSRDSVSVTDSQIKFLLGDNANDNQAVTITRDGSTSTDVVALNIGNKLKIKRNGGGTPSFSADNAGFLYSQNYDTNDVSNTNVFNNGAGFGARGNYGSLFGLLAANGRAAIFGAVNSAGAGLLIMNPNDYSRPGGVGPYYSGGGMSTSFKNSLGIYADFGVKNAGGDYQTQVLSLRLSGRANSRSHDYNGYHITGTPRLELAANTGNVSVTNGSTTVTCTTLRGHVEPGMTVYIADDTSSAYLSASANYTKYTIDSVDSGTNSIELTTNYVGTTGTANAWIQDKILRVQSFNGSEKLTVYETHTEIDGPVVTDAVDFNLTSPPTLSDGRLAYDIDRETLVFQSEHGELAIGEGYKPVYNNTGSTIAKGATVKATGVSGEKFLIELFDASSGVDEELYFVGVTQAAINNQTAGIVVSEGYVKHLDTSSYSVGDILYASETAGELTSTKPTSPNLGIPVAMVTKSDATNGTIYVRPTIYAHLAEMHDVLTISPATGNLLQYNSVLGVWYNTSAVSGLTSIGTGSLTVTGSSTLAQTSVSSLTFSSLGASTISPGVLETDLDISSNGNVSIKLDADNNETGQKFAIFDPGTTERFSVDDSGVAKINNAYTLPTADGTNGQVLTTNGSGAASWADAGGGGKSSTHSGYLEIKSTSTTREFTGPTNGIYASDYTTGNNSDFITNHNGTAPTAGTTTISQYPYYVRGTLVDLHHDVSEISINARLRDSSSNAAGDQFFMAAYALSGGAAETFTQGTYTCIAVGTGTIPSSSTNITLGLVSATNSGLSLSAGDSVVVTFGWIDTPTATPDISVNWSMGLFE